MTEYLYQLSLERYTMKSEIIHTSSRLIMDPESKAAAAP